jgi:hypothetical protein
MRVVIILIAVIFSLVAPLTAQRGDCRNGVSCDQIPWRLPALPFLPSPTPFPTVAATVVPTTAPTSTANPTLGPSTPQVEINSIADGLATVQAMINVTPELINNPYGDAVLTGNIGLFFGYARGLSTASMGIFTPIITFIFFAFFSYLSIKAIFFILPLIAALIGLVRKVIQTVLDFIPGL